MNKDLEIIALRPQLISFFLSKTGVTLEKAEGLYQDLYIKTKLSLDSGVYIEEGKFKKWIFKVANNLLMDYYRYRNRVSRKTFSTYGDLDNYILLQDPDPSIEEILINEDEIEILKKVISRLSPRQKEVVEMRIFKNMAFREVVEETGRGLNTVLGNYRYGIIKIKKVLKLWNRNYQLKT